MRRALLGLLVVAACGDDAAASDDDTKREDASVAPRLDAGAPDMDAQVVAQEDAGGGDSGEPLPSYAECRGFLASYAAATVSGRGFSSAIALNTLYVAFPQASCGGSASSHTAEGIGLVALPTSGAPGVPTPLLNAGAGDCARTTLPTLQNLRGTLHVYYASNQDGSPQLYDYQADAGALPLTMGNGVWPDDMTTNRSELIYARGNALYAQPSGGVAEPLVLANEGYAIARVAASELGALLSMVAWTSDAASMSGVYLRVRGVDAAPQRVGDIGTRSGLALASQSKRGAVVFSDATGSMFLRTVELSGALGEPRRLTSGNQTVSDISMARYGVGYTIAFRATPATSDQAVIRLLMVDELGNAAKPRVISQARSDGRGVEVRVANDGRIVVVWADPTDDGGTAIRVARLDCI